MSLVLNMVGGGGGSLKDTDAILTVTVPTGSTVTMTKGGITLPPTMWVQAADNTLDCALFVIAPAQFDATTPWTVTATLGTDSATTTVLINSNKQYDLDISFKLYLFRHGVGVGSGYTYRVTTNGNASPAYHVNQNEFSLRNYTLTFQPAVDVTNYTELNCEVSEYTPTLNSFMVIGENDDAAGSTYGTANASIYINGVGTYTLDISSYSGDYYIKFYGFTIVVTNVWLSK